ncbi:hypothetical protein BSZ35_14950 [Salinibacter sp. 10B]|uniref:DUF3341 domain-containing protein n=1 Tax=Salinibacter sp. 10B TaxID=1923971 RepID=UPI000D27E646|nr:DUF3341 domain-containing protein [Salinibacter sp. 10B]PQJ35719.1 hypothetical protein BSZ35_14950 [Salinibacter sp. 10B]
MLNNLIREAKATMGIYESDADQVYGLLAEFPNPGALLHAAEAVREEGYRHFDTHSPFPIHGMDDAMGLGNSKVGYFSFLGGVTGFVGAYLLQWWTAAVDYPINISGKPFFAVEPSVPIMFELTVLFAAFGAVAGMLALNGLPRPYNPLFYSDRFEGASDDRFFLHIAASDEQFDSEETAAMLRRIGARHIELVQDDGVSDP